MGHRDNQRSQALSGESDEGKTGVDIQRRRRVSTKLAGGVYRSGTLRYLFVTRLLEAGYDIGTIRKLMGHKDVSTTMIYTHVSTREVMAFATQWMNLDRFRQTV